MRKALDLLCDESGHQTVEFVIWVPIIIGLMVIAVDAATLYLTHNEMWNVARDTARRMSTGQIASAEEAETYAVDAMSLRDHPYGVHAVYDTDGAMEVAVTMAFENISILGYSPLTIFGGTLVARVSMRAAPDIVTAGTIGGNGAAGSR